MNQNQNTAPGTHTPAHVPSRLASEGGGARARRVASDLGHINSSQRYLCGSAVPIRCPFGENGTNTFRERCLIFRCLGVC